MFYYLQYNQNGNNTVMVGENTPAYLYTQYGHIRQRCCSVRCMRMFN